MKYILVTENVITLKMMAHIVIVQNIYELHLKSGTDLNATNI